MVFIFFRYEPECSERGCHTNVEPTGEISPDSPTTGAVYLLDIKTRRKSITGENEEGLLLEFYRSGKSFIEIKAQGRILFQCL